MIVKSSELTRTGRREGGNGGEKVFHGLVVSIFFSLLLLAMKSRSQGPKGRKVQNQARKVDRGNQGRAVGDGGPAGRWAQEDRAGGLLRVGTGVARTRLCSLLSPSGF